MLKVIVNNTKNTLNCRLDCDLYDDITDQCSVLVKANIDDVNTLSDCLYFLPKSTIPKIPFGTGVQPGHLLSASKEEMRLYPLFPDEPPYRDDAVWFFSQCKTYGCWIINHSKHKLFSLDPSFSIKFAEQARTYRFPHPLHNHKAPVPLASKVVWYVNEGGLGSYMLLNEGELIPIQKSI